MASIQRERLDAEWEAWPHMRPYGFGASREKNDSPDWICGVPGPKYSEWEGGFYRVVM